MAWGSMLLYYHLFIIYFYYYLYSTFFNAAFPPLQNQLSFTTTLLQSACITFSASCFLAGEDSERSLRRIFSIKKKKKEAVKVKQVTHVKPISSFQNIGILSTLASSLSLSNCDIDVSTAGVDFDSATWGPRPFISLAIL